MACGMPSTPAYVAPNRLTALDLRLDPFPAWEGVIFFCPLNLFDAIPVYIHAWFFLQKPVFCGLQPKDRLVFSQGSWKKRVSSSSPFPSWEGTYFSFPLNLF